ncbi:MAG: DUF1735 domain-containing protein [Bacteroidetes bacterium]|jgi:azurin|nr:DUF1735 domain-containing protein [Bacteroidota bacterium]
MKKRLYLIATILLSAAALSLSSCLKDNRYVNFASGSNLVYFTKGGTPYFSTEAITETPDTDANGTIVRQFAVGIATVNPTTTATTVKLAVDTSIVAGYSAANPGVNYVGMPTDAYVFTATTVTIPAGQQYATISVTFYKNKLDPSKSYMLPIKIVGNSAGLKTSGNMGIQYYHFIGNDFAGSYELIWTRWNAPDTTGTPAYDHLDLGPYTFLPVDPTTFKVSSGYYTGIPYTVTFTKTGTGPSATYSNFQVVFTAADIKTYFTDPGQGVVLGAAPVYDPNKIPFDPTKQYTYAEALKLFRFYYTTASRAIIDEYVKN